MGYKTISHPGRILPMSFLDSAMPLVSVVIAHRNGLQYLRESLDSVAAQTFTNFEIILVDDGSDVPIPDEILQGLPNLTFIPLPKRGPTERRGVAHAANVGIQRSRGAYIARHDADDIMLPHRLQLQVQRLEDTSLPHVDVLAGQLQTFPADRRYAYPTSMRGFKAALLFGNPIAQPTAMIRRDACIDNPYSEREEDVGYEDLELWLRLFEKGYDFACLSDVLTLYRLHPKQVTRTTTKRNADRLLALVGSVSAQTQDLEALAWARDQRRSFAALRHITNGQFGSDTYAVLQIFLNWLNVKARSDDTWSATTVFTKGIAMARLALSRMG